MKKILLATLVIVLVGAAAYFVVLVRPWTAGPPVPRATVEARWAEVRTWAALERREAGDPQLLVAAVAKLEEERVAVADFLRGWEDARRAGAAQPASAAAPASLEPAVALLVRWHQEGGGLGPKVAPFEPPRAIDLLSLGRVALATTGPDPAAPRRAAALHLGRALRRNGTLLDAAVGFKLAAESGPPCTGPFAPEGGEVFAALAAEAVYSYESTAAQLQKTPRREGWPPPAKDRPRGAPVPVERELLMLRWHLAETLHDAAPIRAEPDHLAQWLEGAGQRELPKSTLVRVASPVARYGQQARRMADDLYTCQTGKRVRREPRY